MKLLRTILLSALLTAELLLAIFLALQAGLAFEPREETRPEERLIPLEEVELWKPEIFEGMRNESQIHYRADSRFRTL